MEPASTADMGRLGVFDPGGERLDQLDDLFADTETGAVSFAGVAIIRRGPRRRACGKELARRLSVRRGETLAADAEPSLFAQDDVPYPSPDTKKRRLTLCR
jgi:hypothetical protein